MSTPVPAASLPEADAPPSMPPFTRTKYGYHPDQVHHYIGALLDRIHNLESGLTHHARDAAPDVLHAAESPQGRALLADLMKLAGDEITGQKAAAAAEASDMLRHAGEDAEAKLAGAAKQAGSIVAAAEEEARKLVAGARTQADTVLATAHSQAKETVDRASAHAAAVDEGAQRRLENMQALHGETTRRLAEIHDVTGSVLAADADRGSLQDEVVKATTALAGSKDVPPPAALESGEQPAVGY